MTTHPRFLPIDVWLPSRRDRGSARQGEAARGCGGSSASSKIYASARVTTRWRRLFGEELIVIEARLDHRREVYDR